MIKQLIPVVCASVLWAGVATAETYHFADEINVPGLSGAEASHPVLVKAGGDVALLTLDVSEESNTTLRSFVFSEESGTFEETTLTGLPANAQPLATERYKGYQYVLFHEGLWRTSTTSLHAWERVSNVQGDALIKKNKRLIVVDSTGYAWVTKQGAKWTRYSLSGLGEPHDSSIRSHVVWNNVAYANVYRQDERGNQYATILKSRNGYRWTPAFSDVFESEETQQQHIGGLFVFNNVLRIMSTPETLRTDWWTSADGATLNMIDPDDVVGRDLSVVSVRDGQLSVVIDGTDRWTTADMMTWKNDVGSTVSGEVKDRMVYNNGHYIVTHDTDNRVEVFFVTTQVE